MIFVIFTFAQGALFGAFALTAFLRAYEGDWSGADLPAGFAIALLWIAFGPCFEKKLSGYLKSKLGASK